MINSREVRAAIEFYNRAQDNGDPIGEIDYPPIKALEEALEEMIIMMRQLSNMADEADKLWNMGDVKNIVNQAETADDYPVDSVYPKRWWKNIIMPQVDAIKLYLETTPDGGKSPNEVFYDRPPKRTESATNEGI